uniref:Uncharacterized protein n=1 Tax=Arundo donax TaxID=35708 RepID=A0A0A8YRE6_ARUDO
MILKPWFHNLMLRPERCQTNLFTPLYQSS